MSHIPEVLGGLARLLSYPDQHTAQTAEWLFVVLSGEIPAAASELSKFGLFLEQHDGSQVEESFTGTFDVNPACALEVGWHLFGEEYARGMFLVRMREELRKYSLPESNELPDHISHVLAVVASMPAEEAAKFVRACVQPAVQKMNEALAKQETPYRHVVACLALVITQCWGAARQETQEQVLESGAPAADPLHAFPVADVTCGGCSEPEVVRLKVNPAANGMQKHQQ